MAKKRWKLAGINFDHMHMGDLLRMAHAHPDVEIVGVCHNDRDRMADAVQAIGLPESRVFTDYELCLEKSAPDIVVLCPATGDHADWTEMVAPFGAHILMEKPFAASCDDARRMIAAVEEAGTQLMINWPLRWVASHVTAKRLVDDGVIGPVREVHYYDGNRGPLWHVADKAVTTAEYVASEKPDSWWYKKTSGGGSLLDYLGYGVTLGSWYLDGAEPLEVTCTVDDQPGLEVDEHSITVARYPFGLSKFETRWGTFSDPWTHQPQPKCGFVIVGTDGTIASYDYEPTVRLQTRDHPEGRDLPAGPLEAPFQNPIQYFVHCLENEQAVDGPLSPALSLLGQRIVDSAVLSAASNRVGGGDASPSHTTGHTCSVPRRFLLLL